MKFDPTDKASLEAYIISSIHKTQMIIDRKELDGVITPEDAEKLRLRVDRIDYGQAKQSGIRST